MKSETCIPTLIVTLQTAPKLYAATPPYLTVSVLTKIIKTNCNCVKCMKWIMKVNE